MEHPIVKEIEDEAMARGLAPATITSRAVGNSRLYQHLKSGGDCTTRTIARIREFIVSRGEPPMPNEAAE